MNSLKLMSQRWVVNERMTVIKALAGKGQLLLRNNRVDESVAILAMVEVIASPENDRNYLESKRAEIESMLSAD